MRRRQSVRRGRVTARSKAGRVSNALAGKSYYIKCANVLEGARVRRRRWAARKVRVLQRSPYILRPAPDTAITQRLAATRRRAATQRRTAAAAAQQRRTRGVRADRFGRDALCARGRDFQRPRAGSACFARGDDLPFPNAGAMDDDGLSVNFVSVAGVDVDSCGVARSPARRLSAALAWLWPAVPARWPGVPVRSLRAFRAELLAPGSAGSLEARPR